LLVRIIWVWAEMEVCLRAPRLSRIEIAHLMNA
jgi:hypothetical protein